jgi:hypothetical protein
VKTKKKLSAKTFGVIAGATVAAAAAQAAKARKAKKHKLIAAKIIEDADADLETIAPTIYVNEVYGDDGEPIEDEELLDAISDEVQDEINKRWAAYTVLVEQVMELGRRLLEKPQKRGGTRRTPGRAKRKMKA